MNQIYFKEVGAIPTLTREEQQALVVRVKAGDESARESLISSFLKLVVHYAKGMEKYLAADGSLTIDDLICEGNFALIDAVNSYNPDSGATLSYYAGVVIKRRIISFISNNNSSIKIPERKLKELLKQAKLEESSDFEHEPRENKTFIPTKVNFNEFEDNHDDDEDLKEMWETVEIALKSVRPREKEIIEMYFGLNDTERKTQEQIGNAYNVSKGRINQIIQKSLYKLRELTDERSKKCLALVEDKSEIIKHQVITSNFH